MKVFPFFNACCTGHLEEIQEIGMESGFQRILPEKNDIVEAPFSSR
jgi:hypothetical protein